MILAGQYEIETTDDIGKTVVKLLPNPDKLHKNTLLVRWSEEAVLDKAMGIFWPIHFSILITEAYHKRGFVLKGFKTGITFPEMEGCLVTFTKEP